MLPRTTRVRRDNDGDTRQSSHHPPRTKQAPVSSSSSSSSLTWILTRSIAILLLLSAIVNVLYYSQLPSPSTKVWISPSDSVFLRTNNNNNTTTHSQSVPQLLSKHQVVKRDKHGNIVHDGSIHQVRAQDLKGIMGDDDRNDPKQNDNVIVMNANKDMESIQQGREPLLQLLQNAGVTDIDGASISKLPLWKDVTMLYGDTVVLHGIDRCDQFRRTIPKQDASIAVAGLFNTGTNPLAMYLSANCQMPHNENDKSHGMRWQVPWGKHVVASHKWNNTAKHDTKVNKTNVMPIVMIRDPFSWMQSMCRHPYAAKWHHTKAHCPNLVKDNSVNNNNMTPGSVPVTLEYPFGLLQWPSLLDLWSDWYNQYLDADYPRLITRFEDLIFRPKDLVRQVCECAGATLLYNDSDFQYVVGAGKWGDAHKGSSNMISAMIKYGTPKHRFTNLTAADHVYASQHLDRNLMQLFRYAIPDFTSMMD